MGLFEVSGSTLVYWKLQVQASGEDEAAEEAQRLSAQVEIPLACAELGSRQNCVFECRELPPEEDAA